MLVLLIALMMIFPACTNSNTSAPSDEGPVNLDNDENKTSYVIGYDIGTNFKKILTAVNLDYFFRGMRDAAAEKESPLKKEESDMVIAKFRSEMMKRDEEQRKKQGEKNKIEGEKFLAENAKREGVKVTESGLQYEVLKEGDGSHAKPTDYVKVEYKGTLIDGTEFDSTAKQGKPMVINPNRVIPAWAEGIKLMKEGSKYRFYVPPALAYGERGMGNAIGPNAVLIFEINFLNIEEAPVDKKRIPSSNIPKEYIDAQKKDKKK
jgi:FKBP-type peptidyl-prolyl cis-trans isomerase